MALTRSSVRTLKVRAAYPRLPLDWPLANSDEALDYSLDINEQLADINDTLASVSVSIAPNGPLELQCSSVSVSQGHITVDLAGGLGRKYKIKIEGATATGEVFSWLIGLQVRSLSPLFSVWPLHPPKGYGFGDPVVWTISGQVGLVLKLSKPLTVSVAAVVF